MNIQISIDNKVGRCKQLDHFEQKMQKAQQALSQYWEELGAKQTVKNSD